MTPNAKPSEHLALLATLDPVSQAPATVVTAWVPVKNFFALLALLDVGVMTATSTVDAKLRQATDNAGTGAKDITGKAITQLLAAGGNNRQVFINMKVADLDTENNFAFVALSITVGTAASLISAALLGLFPRFEDAAAYNQAGVAQVV
jgi:uncharacterized membrane protein